MNALANDELRYAGFWARLSAFLVDDLIQLPLIAITLWCGYGYRLFDLYYIIPSCLFLLFYDVYLVSRYGGTPGKLIMGIRIRKLNGEPVGYREALFRYLPEFVLQLLLFTAMIISALHMTDSEFQTLSIVDWYKRRLELAPTWWAPVDIALKAWTCSEFFILLTNRKRRALQDFIAGTVVVHVRPKGENSLP